MQLKACQVECDSFDSWWNDQREPIKLRKKRLQSEKDCCVGCQRYLTTKGRVPCQWHNYYNNSYCKTVIEIANYNKPNHFKPEKIEWRLKFDWFNPEYRIIDCSAFYYIWFNPRTQREKIFLHPYFYIMGIRKETRDVQEWKYLVYTAKQYQGFLYFLSFFPLLPEVKRIIAMRLALLFFMQKTISYISDALYCMNGKIIVENGKILNRPVFGNLFKNFLSEP